MNWIQPPYPFVDEDFLPSECFEFFPLAWRWRPEKHNVLPPETLSEIRPFMEWKAQEIAYYGRRYFVVSTPDHRFEVAPHVFSGIERIDASSLNPETVCAWLRARGIAPETQIIVSWDQRTAALTAWKVFCKHWDDFCYPGSDEPTIWPMSEEWALVWWHEEWFSFGRRSAGGEAT